MSLTSKAFVIKEDGSMQPLTIGARIPAGTKIELADDAQLQTAPANDKAQVNSVDLNPLAQHSADGLTDIEKLQKALMQGEDPTQQFEATAAGGATGAGGASGSGNGGFITVERTSDSTLASAGYDTTHDATLSQTDTPALLEPRPLRLIRIHKVTI